MIQYNNHFIPTPPLCCILSSYHVLVRRGSHYFLPTLHRAQDSFRSKLCTTRCCAKSEILYVVLCIVFPQDVIRNRRKLLSREILFIVESLRENAGTMCVPKQGIRSIEVEGNVRRQIIANDKKGYF